MPKDYKSFCLVAAHLVHNAHRYYSKEDISPLKVKQDCSDVLERNEEDLKKDFPFVDCKAEKCDEVRKKEMMMNVMKINNGNDADALSKQVNKNLREIHTLKRQNRIKEHHEKVEQLKAKFTYRQLSDTTKIPLKTLPDWCSESKEKKHKASV